MEIKRLALEHDSSAMIRYESQALCYRIEWVEPQDELASLLREYLNDQGTQSQRRDRIDALIQKTQLKVVGK